MGYGKKIKDWFTEDVDDDLDVYTDEVDVEPKTSIFEQAHSQRTSEAVKAFNANKDSHLILFEPRALQKQAKLLII